MNLPNPPGQYNQQDQQSVRGEIERADKANVKQGGTWEIDKGYPIFKDTADGSRWKLTVVSGALTLTAL